MITDDAAPSYFDGCTYRFSTNSTDREVQIIEVILQALCHLPPGDRLRVLHYVTERTGADS